MAFEVAINEKGVVITLSPGLIPKDSSATCRAVVPEEVAMLCSQP
ncbi:hypothetical protein SDC9_146251 [bioreactor metagenome]|uniref:Uncharacterized protein n=1 Tax=bioreactor metagenome TaxID=1076179 RepID=A0A645ECJ2_9ZZZZ